MNIMRSIKFLAILFFLVIFCVSCATTHQTRSAATSGFLSDYSQLKEGKDGQALLMYIDEDVNFDLYDKIIIDPVHLVASEGSDMASVSKENLQAVADYFHAVLNQNLSEKYTIVQESGPGTMRLRVALTDVTGSVVVRDILSSYVPVCIAVNVISNVATGDNTAVGSATAEMELLDSVSGKRLAASVDSRSGIKYTGKLDKFNKWQDAKDACDYWAEHIATHLDKLSEIGYILKGDEE
jgi:uncharacterized protein DUF3313